VLKRLVRGVSGVASAAAAQRALSAGTARDAEQVLRLALAQELGAELLDGLLGLA
jgi:hypothetical protein